MHNDICAAARERDARRAGKEAPNEALCGKAGRRRGAATKRRERTRLRGRLPLEAGEWRQSGGWRRVVCPILLLLLLLLLSGVRNAAESSWQGEVDGGDGQKNDKSHGVVV